MGPVQGRTFDLIAAAMLASEILNESIGISMFTS
jgi:hypothetical protein